MSGGPGGLASGAYGLWIEDPELSCWAISVIINVESHQG
jgi:hypothetical protein